MRDDCRGVVMWQTDVKMVVDNAWDKAVWYQATSRATFLRAVAARLNELANTEENRWVMPLGEKVNHETE